jgi:ABC-type nitrate/sulfonate/bicarbonate transport system substrate-binding protein
MSRATIRQSESRRVSAALGGFRLGYVPLIDALPLLVADAMGFFERENVSVSLSRELGWGSIREKIVYGELDGAPAPAGLLFSILLGTHAPACPVSTDLVMNVQGNAITLSRRLWEKGVRDARTFRLVVRGEAPRRPVFAVVSPFSSHHFLLREWLRSAGLDPDRDVRITALPPPLVAEHMREGQIDGFCAGEPWNSGAALSGDGWVVATSAQLAPGHVEKVLLMRNDSRVRQPEAYAALRRALVEACKYCDQPENRPALVDFLHNRGIFPLPKEALANSLVGPFQTGAETLENRRPFISFYREGTNRATRDRAQWSLEGILDSHVTPLETRSRQLCLDSFIDEEPAVAKRASLPRRKPRVAVAAQ